MPLLQRRALSYASLSAVALFGTVFCFSYRGGALPAQLLH